MYGPGNSQDIVRIQNIVSKTSTTYDLTTNPISHINKKNIGIGLIVSLPSESNKLSYDKKTITEIYSMIKSIQWGD